jgi:hypothetical protein
MANAAYPSFLELLLGGDIDLVTDPIAVALLSSGYTFNTAHDFRDDLTNVIAISDALTSKTIVDGVFDAANGLAESVSGADIAAVSLFRVVGTAATDDLIVFLDGLSLTPNGNNINIVWNASGIFAL